MDCRPGERLDALHKASQDSPLRVGISCSNLCYAGLLLCKSGDDYMLYRKELFLQCLTVFCLTHILTYLRLPSSIERLSPTHHRLIRQSEQATGSAFGFFTLFDWRQLNSEGKWSPH